MAEQDMNEKHNSKRGFSEIKSPDSKKEKNNMHKNGNIQRMGNRFYPSK